MITFKTASPKILVTRTDRIGDLILSTPIFSELRKKFPAAWITGLTFCENREILESNRDLDEVILYDKKGQERGLFGNFFFARKLAKKKFDCVIHLHATNRIHAVGWLAGIPVRIGWDRRLPKALTHVFEYVKKKGEKHEAFYNFDLLEPFKIGVPEKMKTKLPVSVSAIKSVDEWLAQRGIVKNELWIVVSPGASGPEKIWPTEKFGQLIDQLSKKYKARFFSIGARKDRRCVEKMKKNCLTDFVDTSGHWSLGMLAAFLQKCDLLISNDSGPVHVAGAVGTKTISIFVRSEPGVSSRRWGPLSQNAMTLDKQPVEVEDVLQAVEEIGIHQENGVCSS